MREYGSVSMPQESCIGAQDGGGIMAKSKGDGTRYGVGEWYGHLIADLSHEQLAAFGKIRASKFAEVPCPFRLDADPAAQCKKKGGVCSIRRHRLNEDESVSLEGPLVTLCPSRFWSKNKVFEEIGQLVLGVTSPTLVKEVQFLTSIVDEGDDEKAGDAVGRIDTIIVDPDDVKRWCALEIQAVYFSGDAMGEHLGQYEHATAKPVFPEGNRRPDFRSSGPKRLMPQLQVKVPTLRRWGKKMAVVIDKPFADSLGKFVEVPHVSNCDIIWIVVDFDSSTGQMSISRKIFTTLESSVEALTAGVPLSLDEFEGEMYKFLTGKNKQARAKVVRLTHPEPSPEGGSEILDGAELPEEH